MAQSFECAHENCEFAVRAADESIVVAMARKHERDRHGVSVDTSEVEGRIETTET